jgi:hypothetical protein
MTVMMRSGDGGGVGGCGALSVMAAVAQLVWPGPCVLISLG